MKEQEAPLEGFEHTLLHHLKKALRGRRAVAATTVAVLLCCIAVVLALEPLTPRAPTVAAAVEAPAVASAPTKPSGAVAMSRQGARPTKVELITLRSDGFSPRQITRSAGPVLIAINNRSGFKEPTLRLDRAAGARLREVRLPARKIDWRGLVDLTPGEYVLTEASHPTWTCTITVTPQ